MNYLARAKKIVTDDKIVHESAREEAKVCALIAIAEELKKLNVQNEEMQRKGLIVHNTGA